MPNDFEQVLDTAIWAILEANADFTTTFAVGNRLKAYSDSLPRQRTQRAPSEYPKCMIDVGSESLGQNAMRTFAQNDVDYSPEVCDHVIPLTNSPTITLVYQEDDARGVANQTKAESLVQSLLMSKFPKLGLTDVDYFTIAKTRGVMPSGPHTGKPFARFAITVTRKPFFSALASLA